MRRGWNYTVSVRMPVRSGGERHNAAGAKYRKARRHRPAPAVFVLDLPDPDLPELEHGEENR